MRAIRGRRDLCTVGVTSVQLLTVPLRRQYLYAQLKGEKKHNRNPHFRQSSHRPFKQSTTLQWVRKSTYFPIIFQFSHNKKALFDLGTPLVKCGPEKIEVSAGTAKPFQGVVYIKNWRRVEGCYVATRNDTSTSQSPSLSIDLSALNRCGMEMKRDVSQKRLEIADITLQYHINYFSLTADKQKFREFGSSLSTLCSLPRLTKLIPFIASSSKKK